MLIKVNCMAHNGPFERIINTRTVLYIDKRGVLFAPNNHAVLAVGEFKRIKNLLRQEGVGYVE